MDSATWATTIISTGEFSLLARSSRNIGLYMRLIEFDGVQWTPDAMTADKIRDCIKKNYGHAVPMLAQGLLQQGKEECVNVWKNASRSIEQMLEGNRYAHRLSKKYALILASAKLARRILGIHFTLGEMAAFLISNGNSNEEDLYLGKAALRVLVQQVSLNISKFKLFYPDYMTLDDLNDAYTPRSEYWGVYQISKVERDGRTVNETELFILTTVFEKMMLENRFESPKTVLHELRDSGHLRCEKDRFKCRANLILNGEPVDVYQINVTGLVDEKQLPNKKTTPANP